MAPEALSHLQREARALGDPTRFAIFRHIVESATPVTIAELTAHFKLNHNAIRQHLAKLVEADLVVEATAPAGGPGRPKLLYTQGPSVESRWGVVGPYERLSLLLAEAVRTGERPIEVGRKAGLRLVADSSADPGDLGALVEVMTEQGFEPQRRGSRASAELVLHNCPFANVARADPDSVCSLHLGMAEGIVAGTDYVVEELVRKDPRRAGCRLRLHRKGATHDQR